MSQKVRDTTIAPKGTPAASVKMQAAVVTMQHCRQADAGCTLPVLRCTEV
jgi:hypothetical protein